MTGVSRTVRLAQRCSLLVAGWLAGSSSGSLARDFVSDHLAGPVEIVHGTGADGTLNVVILGDGFTAAQMDKYRDAVDRLVTKWVATEPFAFLSNTLTIYRLDVISDGAGIDVPANCGGEPFDTPLASNGKPFEWSRSEKHPDNVLETHWCAEDKLSGQHKKRFIGSDGKRVSDFVHASNVVPNITIVIVNDWMFGATALPDSGVVYVSLSQNLVGDINPDTNKVLKPNDPSSFPAVVMHEVGHLAPFRLLDEYSIGRPDSDLPGQEAVIKASPNLTTVLSPLPWEGLVAAGIKRPTNCKQHPVPAVGAVEGGYGFAHSVFHSRCTCKMNDYSDAEFCLVCRQQISTELGKFTPKPHQEP